MKTLLFEINLKTTFYFTALTPRRHHYDNCQFYFRMPTIGTRARARKGEEEENGALDLLDDRHSGDPINITLDANTKSAWGTSLQGQLPSVQRQAATVAVVFTVKHNRPLSNSAPTLQPLHWKITQLTIIAILFQHSAITTWQWMCLKEGATPTEFKMQTVVQSWCLATLAWRLSKKRR